MFICPFSLVISSVILFDLGSMGGGAGRAKKSADQAGRAPWKMLPLLSRGVGQIPGGIPKNKSNNGFEHLNPVDGKT